MKHNPLIYGKNELDRIVAIECNDEIATIYRELEDGSRDVVEVPHRYWILSNRQYSDKWFRLEGNQHYKWGKQYSKLTDFLSEKNSFKKRGADIYAISNASEAFQIKNGYTLFKGMKHNQINILGTDIETTGLYHNKDSKIVSIANTFRSAKGEITRKLFWCSDYANCAQLIDAWAEWVREVDPSLIINHNLYCFDLPYLDYCYKKHKRCTEVDYTDEQGVTYYKEVKGIPLGRNGEPMTFMNYESKKRIDGSRDLHYKKCTIHGRQIVDTMFLAYNYDAVEKKYESYGLKSIIAQEGLEKPGRVFYDASTIRDNYMKPEEIPKIKAYNIDDGDDVIALWDLMGASVFYLTQSVPKPFQLMIESASGSQINSVLVRAYLQDKQSVAKADDLSESTVEGGISFAVPGIYKNVFKIDIKSCYPSQILRFKLFDKIKDPKAYYHELVEFFTLQRFEYKQKLKETGDLYWKNLDATAKIFINSSYGVANTNGLNYNSADIARKITSESRAVIDMSLRWASGNGYKYWIDKFYDTTKVKEKDRKYLEVSDYLKVDYNHDFSICPSDTDSISFCAKDGEPLEKIDQVELLRQVNELSPDKILWEDDGYYPKIIALKAKNYILYDGKKIKIKGSALKASTRSTATKEFIKAVIDILVYTDNELDMHEKLKKLYWDYVLEINDVKDITRFAARKTLSSKMEESERANETKVMDAIKGTDIKEGDRFHVFYKNDDTLSLVQNFNGDYNKIRLFKNLHDTIMIFGFVIPQELFVNYALKKNQALLPGYVAPPVKEKKVSKPKLKELNNVQTTSLN
jgi:DNA polymerase elongation subunit (family B)